jgi:hypothetical protein
MLWNTEHDECVVGGPGHVGLPIAIVLASRQLRTLILTSIRDFFQTGEGGGMPFIDAHPVTKDFPRVANRRDPVASCVCASCRVV